MGFYLYGLGSMVKQRVSFWRVVFFLFGLFMGIYYVVGGVGE